MKHLAVAIATVLSFGAPAAIAETCMIKGQIPVPCWNMAPDYHAPAYRAPIYRHHNSYAVYDDHWGDDYYVGDYGYYRHRRAFGGYYGGPFHGGPFFGGYYGLGPSISFGFGFGEYGGYWD
jgi:hypothetical protein